MIESLFVDASIVCHARIQKDLSEGVQLWQRFLVDEGREYSNTSIQILLKHASWAIIGPPAKRHLNDVPLWADDGPTLDASLVALCFFRGSGPVLLRIHLFL